MKNIFTTLFFLAFALVAQAQIDRTQMPEPGPAPEINLKDPQTFELRNGLKVLVVENHKLPRVSIQLSIDNPPVLEGAKAGVSALTGSLLGKGSKNIKKDDFKLRLKTVTDKAITNDHELDIHSEFFVDAEILGL